MAKPDWQIVHEILERSTGKDTITTAKVIAEVLGKRIRQRHRDPCSGRGPGGGPDTSGGGASAAKKAANNGPQPQVLQPTLCQQTAEKKVLNSVAEARKKNFVTAVKGAGKAYGFTSLIGCVGGLAPGGVGCPAGAVAADAVATPMIVGGASFWFLVTQGYDVTKAAIQGVKDVVACNENGG